MTTEQAEWQHVTRQGRSNARNRGPTKAINHQPRADSMLEDKLKQVQTESQWFKQLNQQQQAEEVIKVKRLIDFARLDVIEQNDFVTHITQSLITSIEEFARRDDTLLQSPTEAVLTIDLICLGVGSVVHSKSARYQFALMCLVHEKLIEAQLTSPNRTLRFNLVYYDPLCSDYDRAVVESCDFVFDATNHEGRYGIQHGENGSRCSIVFAPHCTPRLSMNVLESNWGHSLDRLILIANSFQLIVESRKDIYVQSKCLDSNSQTGHRKGSRKSRRSDMPVSTSSDLRSCRVHTQTPSMSESSLSCSLGSICCVISNNVVTETPLDETLTSTKGDLYSAFHSLSIHRFSSAVSSDPADDLHVWDEWKSFQWDANAALSHADSAELITAANVP